MGAGQGEQFELCLPNYRPIQLLDVKLWPALADGRGCAAV